MKLKIRILYPLMAIIACLFLDYQGPGQQELEATPDLISPARASNISAFSILASQGAPAYIPPGEIVYINTEAFFQDGDTFRLTARQLRPDGSLKYTEQTCEDVALSAHGEKPHILSFEMAPYYFTSLSSHSDDYKKGAAIIGYTLEKEDSAEEDDKDWPYLFILATDPSNIFD